MKRFRAFSYRWTAAGQNFGVDAHPAKFVSTGVIPSGLHVSVTERTGDGWCEDTSINSTGTIQSAWYLGFVLDITIGFMFGIVGRFTRTCRRAVGWWLARGHL